MTTTSTAVTGERADLLETLAKHRFFLRLTLRDLSDEQASRRTTASELTPGGLIKHVTETETGWARFIVEGPAALGREAGPAVGGPGAVVRWDPRLRLVRGLGREGVGGDLDGGDVPFADERRHPVREESGLARARAGDNEHRAVGRGHLFGVGRTGPGQRPLTRRQPGRLRGQPPQPQPGRHDRGVQ